jgi:hypothetical protein
VPKAPLAVAVGDIVLVLIEPGIRRPLLVTHEGVQAVYDGQFSATIIRQDYRVSGSLFCEPEDRSALLFRARWAPNGDPARVGQPPDRLMPLSYCEHLGPGTGIGQWIPRPTRLPGA